LLTGLRRETPSSHYWVVAPLRQVSRHAAGQRQDSLCNRAAPVFESLLQRGMGDMRSLLRAVGSRTAVKALQHKHSRLLPPLGGWASDIKLGALRLELAGEILRNPDEWPGDLVQRAAEKVGSSTASQATTRAETAKADAWFSLARRRR